MAEQRDWVGKTHAVGCCRHPAGGPAAAAGCGDAAVVVGGAGGAGNAGCGNVAGEKPEADTRPRIRASGGLIRRGWGRV